MDIFYKELLIVDKKEKTARKIQFKKGINIVTSNLNSVGKTSLSLMLLYGFGAKVKFSDKWHLENIITKLTITKDDQDIVIIRYKDTYTIYANGESFFYPVQKYGYSDKLYELLGLTIKIKDKNADTYSTAIPSLYLLPYFLSQTNTDDDRSVFEDLHMYSKPDLHDALYYHVGALDNEYSGVIQNLTKDKKALEQLRKEKEKQIAEIEYLESKLEENKNFKTVDIETDLDSDVASYQKYAEANQKYYQLVKQKADVKHKIKLLNKSLSDNAAYSIKLLNEEEILCPICKSDISEFISSALTVGIAESEIDSEITELKAELLLIDRQLVLLKPKLDALRSEVSKIESYRDNLKVTRAIMVWNDELQSAKKKFADTQLQIEAYEESIKGYTGKVRTYADKKKTSDTTYREAFSVLLDSTNISKQGIDINALNLYDTISLSGSEIPRVAISRFFALLESKNENSIVMPIVFDFPNLDMTEDNLIRCFALMCDKIIDTDKYPQSFIFSINCIERIEKAGRKLESANIIDMGKLLVDDMDNPQLLCKEEYVQYASEIKTMTPDL